MDINVNEIFYTIQGEGPNVGKPSIFIRLSGCNLRCYWCDTPYTWLFSENRRNKIQVKFKEKFNKNLTSLEIYDRTKETHKFSVENLIEEIRQYPTKNIVITGGEPLLQIEKLSKLIKELTKNSYNFEIETNGTIDPEQLIFENVRFNVSPKLENSLNDKKKRYIPENLTRYLEANSIFKFVITHKNDIEEIETMIGQLKIPSNRVYLMPEGKTKTEIQSKSQWIIELCKLKNYNYTHRLHIELYGDKRGV